VKTYSHWDSVESEGHEVGQYTELRNCGLELRRGKRVKSGHALLLVLRDSSLDSRYQGDEGHLGKGNKYLGQAIVFRGFGKGKLKEPSDVVVAPENGTGWAHSDFWKDNTKCLKWGKRGVKEKRFGRSSEGERSPHRPGPD